MVDSVTQILRSGPPGTKQDIAVLGDGFAEADQTAYNNIVQEFLLDGVFSRDFFYEDMQAFNIYRVNLISNHSGVSQRVYNNGTLISENIFDTALGYIYNGSWAHCWLEANIETLPDGTKINHTEIKVRNALDTWVPDRNLVVVILNETGWGGCGGGGFQIVTLAVGWAGLAHEFGHGTGGLADEYCNGGVHTGGEPGEVNVTINTDRSTLKWKRYIDPVTPIPTGIGICANYNQGVRPPGWSDDQDVGLFEGGKTKDRGIYRPVINCRMRFNSPPFCPVCYTVLKTKMHPYTGHSFLKCYTGDFNGDGGDDLLVHNNNSVLIYKSEGSKLEIIFSAVGSVPGSWYFQPNDQFYIGDFNGDGKDEVIVYNSHDWVTELFGLLVYDGSNGLRLIARYDDGLPGWPFQKTDKFYVGDFDGDGKKDLFVFNGSDWGIPYMAMVRSNGSSFSVVQRFDGTMPNWQMKPQDRHYVGDFNGDGKDDLWVFNGTNWSFPYLGMLNSNGNNLSMIKRYDNNMPNWQMKPQDRHYVGDFNGDGKKDLFVFNGREWAMAYLGMLKSSGSDLLMVKRYDDNAPGWQMRTNDRHYISDVNGDGKADLFVYNLLDWSNKYLGIMVSNGTSLTCSRKENRIGEWNLGFDDMFEPCNCDGVPGRRDLLVHNQNWLGMIRNVIPSNEMTLLKIYYKWIHNYHYGRNW
jgi:hypothetical protein